MTLYRSQPDHMELVTSLPIGPTGVERWQLVGKLALPEALASSQYTVGGEFQVTNPYTKPVFICSQITLQGDVSARKESLRFNEANGTNVTPDQHHLTVVRTGALFVPVNYNYSLAVCLWAYAAQTSMVGDIPVDAGRGTLWCEVL